MIAALVLLCGTLLFFRNNGGQIIARIGQSGARTKHHTTSTTPLRFVWHVGPMKTGTTSLQTALRKLAPDLLQNDQWDYWILNTTAGVHTAEFFDWTSRHLAACRLERKNVLVSSEYFSIYYRAEHYRRMRQLLLEWRVEVVVVS